MASSESASPGAEARGAKAERGWSAFCGVDIIELCFIAVLIQWTEAEDPGVSVRESRNGEESASSENSISRLAIRISA